MSQPPEGWLHFGTHVEISGPLEFSDEVDEAGLPKWERCSQTKFKQVWTVAYDTEHPSMDGPHRVRMREVSTESEAKDMYDVLTIRSNVPKKNLKIETRFVTDWEDA